MTTPHVFVTMGNLLNFKCDAWLLPTDARVYFNPVWLDALPALAEVIGRTDTSALKLEKTFSCALTSWDAQEPMPVLTAVPLGGVTDPEQLRPRFRAFLETAANAFETKSTSKPPTNRPFPLLAVPFFGTGNGAGGIYRGSILRILLEEAHSAASRLLVDVAFVLQDPAAYALAQQIRKEDPTLGWPALSQSHQQHVVALAMKAKQDKLVPFMGAGVSISAGAPSWDKLLNILAHELGLRRGEREKLAKMSSVDRATIVKSIFSEGQFQNMRGESFGDFVARHVNVHRYGLAPALIAGIGATAAITLNYDTLFEDAANDAGNAVTVIPDDVSVDTARWLLKLHGSITSPDSIVLTRDDYLGYSSNRQALSSLVKAHLLTHHLLFIGFGLTDDHFHEIVFDVRRALPETANYEFGTVLALHDDPLQRRLWDGQLKFIHMGAADGSTTDEEAARTLEVFLDMLAAESSETHAYFLAPYYEGGMSDDEFKLRTELLGFAVAQSKSAPLPAWQVMEESFLKMGWHPAHAYRDSHPNSAAGRPLVPSDISPVAVS